MWTGRLKSNYKNFAEFAAYSRNYNLARRLGYKTAAGAWKDNPIIQWSSNPDDFKVATTPTIYQAIEAWEKHSVTQRKAIELITNNDSDLLLIIRSTWIIAWLKENTPMLAEEKS